MYIYIFEREIERETVVCNVCLLGDMCLAIFVNILDDVLFL